MERVPRRHVNRNVRRERDRRSVVRQVALLACGLLLTCGFVLAAQQQFAAVRYGYQSEDLRRERDELLAEQKRLLLALEQKTSFAQIESAAREIGLQPTRPAQINVPLNQQMSGQTDAPRAPTTFVGSATALSR